MNGENPVTVGDIIPALQTECGRPVTILGWSNRDSKLIQVKISHLVNNRWLTAKELGLKWVEVNTPPIEPSAEMLAEHDVWFKAERDAYRKLNPPPVTAWDGNALYRKIQTHTTSFFIAIRPKADAWWRERGFKVIWRERDAILEPID